MYTVTLLSSPKAPRLETSLLGALQTAWGGGDARWLAPNEAAEFEIGQKPANQWDVWSNVQALGVDLVVQPTEGRRKKMLLADMDSTMINEECIDELAEVAGVGAYVKEITAKAMNGELDFEGALTERVALLAGLDEAIIAQVSGSSPDHIRSPVAHINTRSLRETALLRTASSAPPFTCVHSWSQSCS